MHGRTAKDAVAIPQLAASLPEAQVQIQDSYSAIFLFSSSFPCFNFTVPRYSVLQLMEIAMYPYIAVSAPFQSAGERQ